MANCYCCGRSGANFRRNVSTGSSFGSWGGSRSVGSSSRTYYGLRTVCEPCALQIDRRKRNARIFLLIVLATVVGYFLYARFEKKSTERNPLENSRVISAEESQDVVSNPEKRTVSSHDVFVEKESEENEPVLNGNDSCYDEFEIEMINDGMKNFVPVGKGIEKKYRGKNVTFVFRELENNVGGELVLDGVKYLVNGIYEGEGMYFGAIWKDSQNFGIIDWSYGKCMSISYKNECEESEIELCTSNTNPFFGGVEDNENATGRGIGTPEIMFNKGDRTRLNDVNLDDLKIMENAVVSFRLIVNPDGKIERVETNAERTTTSNMLLISEIRKRVIAQVRYSKSNGSGLEMFNYSVKVSTN